MGIAGVGRYNSVAMIAHSYTFSVVLDPDEDAGGFTVHVPALQGCHTQGDSREEAIAMAQDAITVYIESLLVHNEPIPGDLRNWVRMS